MDKPHERGSRALSYRSIREIEFSFDLTDTGVKTQERVDREVPLFEFELGMGEYRAGLVVERSSAILTQIPLIDPISAVSDRTVRNGSEGI